MYFKTRKIKGNEYSYAARSVRLPNGEVKSLEIIYKGQPKEELERILADKEKTENLRYVLRNFHADYIFTEEKLKKIEFSKVEYRSVIRKISKVALRDLFDRFTANFTYESNALEGNSLTLKDVLMVMYENTSIKGKDLRETYDTRNSREVVELIVHNKFKIAEKDVLRIHKMLVRDTDINPGYKTVPNYILGRRIQTTPPERVKEDIQGLLNWYEVNIGKIHPLKIAAIFHGKFERIHPFEDGNGRVGRFLINTILVNNRYPPLIIRRSQRISYLHALESFDNGHSELLERFLLARYSDTYSKFFEIYWKYLK